MGELNVTINKSQKILSLYCNNKFYSDLINRLIDYFEEKMEHITDIEGYEDIIMSDDLEEKEPLKAVYLKSIILDKNTPMLEEILDITASENEWTLDYSGKLVSLEDTETGVKYSNVIILCAYFDVWEHKLRFFINGEFGEPHSSKIW